MQFQETSLSPRGHRLAVSLTFVGDVPDVTSADIEDMDRPAINERIWHLRAAIDKKIADDVRELARVERMAIMVSDQRTAAAEAVGAGE